MGDHIESFRLLAELALALAGFTGVVVAFVGRERSFDPANRSRLWTMFECSGATLLGAGVIEVMSSAGMPQRLTFISVSTMLLALSTLQVIRALRVGMRLVRDESAVTRPWVVVVAVLISTVVWLLSGVNLILAVAWPLLAAFYLLLFHALWSFYRMLVLRN
jgi:hypothetical protein